MPILSSGSDKQKRPEVEVPHIGPVRRIASREGTAKRVDKAFRAGMVSRSGWIMTWLAAMFHRAWSAVHPTRAMVDKC